jgi:hypothetical protein
VKNILHSKRITTHFLQFVKQLHITNGRATAPAVSSWLPTAAARVRFLGFVVDKVALGQVFSKYFGFPCQSSFHQFLHHHNHPALA